jgi:hypothetical protein
MKWLRENLVDTLSLIYFLGLGAFWFIVMWALVPGPWWIRGSVALGIAVVFLASRR